MSCVIIIQLFWKKFWNCVHDPQILFGYLLMDDSDTKRDRVFKEALQCRVELVAYARSLLNNYTAAEDTVQEAYLVVIKKFDEFQEGTSMIKWCRSIVRVAILRMNQQRRREQTLADRLLEDAIDGAFDEFQIARHDDTEAWQQALRRCLERVPRRGHSVLKARFIDEMSYQQIGKHLGMTLEAVRKSLFRYKKQVRSCVETSLRGAK
jgi:RNA polymerase sigma-70 factor (ECF subfamily)